MSLLWLNDNSNIEVTNETFDMFDLISQVDNFADIPAVLNKFTRDNLKHVKFVPANPNREVAHEVEVDDIILANYFVTTIDGGIIEIHFDLQHVSAEQLLEEKVAELQDEIEHMDVKTPEDIEAITVGKILMGEEE